MADYILAIDQGTTTTTVILVNEAMELCGKESIEFPQYYPKPGWVEHNLEEIWQATLAAIEKVLQKPQSEEAIASQIKKALSNGKTKGVLLSGQFNEEEGVFSFPELLGESRVLYI